jgi:hypothetical protein
VLSDNQFPVFLTALSLLSEIDILLPLSLYTINSRIPYRALSPLRDRYTLTSLSIHRTSLYTVPPTHPIPYISPSHATHPWYTTLVYHLGMYMHAFKGAVGIRGEKLGGVPIRYRRRGVSRCPFELQEEESGQMPRCPFELQKEESGQMPIRHSSCRRERERESGLLSRCHGFWMIPTVSDIQHTALLAS